MGQLDLQGALIGGPPTGGDVFPASTFAVPLRLRTIPKGFGVATGVLTRQVNSPSVFTTLSGIGANDTVTQADVLYFKASGPVALQLTTDDGLGGDIVATLSCDGLVLMEFPTSNFLKGLEVRGSATVEYFASGQR